MSIKTPSMVQKRLDGALHGLRNFLDVERDKRICGISLEKTAFSPFAESHGAVDTINTPYGTLEVMLGDEHFTEEDCLIDVGCGTARPLAYLADKSFPGKLVGVELTPEIADIASAWAQRYENVTILQEDAFNLDLSQFTAYFMWRPMTPDTLARFFEKMEREATRPFRLYYLSDTQGIECLESRPGWTMLRREWIHRVHGIPQHGKAQRYSVWFFTPNK